MPIEQIIIDAVGLSGVGMVLLAYFLMEHETIKSTSFSYLFLNFIGSIFMTLSILHDWNLAGFINNTVWGIVSIYGIIKNIKGKKIV